MSPYQAKVDNENAFYRSVSQAQINLMSFILNSR